MKRVGIAVLVCLLAVGVTASWAQRENRQASAARPLKDERAAPIVDGYYNIGDIHQPVSTESAEAQTWFDRGVAMCYGFNHEEAVRCFDSAIAADPNLAIAYAAKAYALGPNFNNLEVLREQMLEAHAIGEQALARIQHASAAERAVIEAIVQRSDEDIPEEFDRRDPYNEAYATAMEQVYRQFGDTPWMATLYAESLMNLQPWKHYFPDGSPNVRTAEIKRVVEQGHRRWPTHPGLCHLYIHLMELSPEPELALESAQLLGDAVPGSGHLIHMPTHISVLLGDYGDVVERNQRAIDVDKLFVEREGMANFYSLYRQHNYHFLVYGAMFDGQSQRALEAARAMKQQVPEPMLREYVDLLDAYVPTDLHVLIRFGRWEEILEESPPADYLPMSTAIYHYARTLAYAATNRVDEAEAERERFVAAVALVPETNRLFQNTSLSVLELVQEMVDGEIAYRRGEYDDAFAHLRESVRLDDALNYEEPWAWMQPPRHALGALLLEQQHFAEAEQVYRDDLKRHPKNPWALHGLTEALMEQGKLDAARDYAAQCETACERADVKINRSCYCRLNVAADE